MNSYIALFRGINVGGKNILPMKDIAAILEAKGCVEIQTYIQSGNVVFRANKDIEKNGTVEIGREIFARKGFEPKILLLSSKQLQAAIQNNPFPTAIGNALHFFFLESEPLQPNLAHLSSLKTESEEFKLCKDVLYLYTPDGLGRSKLAVAVEKAVGVPATARNWNTVSKLMSMTEGA